MEFEYLDNETEVLLKDLLTYEYPTEKDVIGEAIEYLVERKYVSGISTKTLSDIKPRYTLIGVTQKGKSYFELKKKYEQEQRKITRREWKIAIISALIGAVIGLIPTIITWIQ